MVNIEKIQYLKGLLQIELEIILKKYNFDSTATADRTKMSRSDQSLYGTIEENIEFYDGIIERVGRIVMQNTQTIQ